MITQIPLFDTLQDNIIVALREQAAEDAALSPGYNFEVYANRSIPFATSKSRVVVNVKLPKIDPVSEKSGYRNNIIQRCNFEINFYVETVGDGIENQDIITDKRRFFLTAQILNALTNNKNITFGLDEIDISLSIPIEFNEKVLDKESSSLFASGRMGFMAEIPYKTADLENLPDLTALELNISDIYTALFIND